MLILGFEPVNVRKSDWLTDSLKSTEGFDDIYETALRSDCFTAKGHWVRPRDFLAWAHEKGYRVPKRLEGLVNRFHPEQVAAENSDLTQNETTGDRRARITARHRELEAGGDRYPTKTVAKEEGISAARVRQLMNPARPVPKAR